MYDSDMPRREHNQVSVTRRDLTVVPHAPRAFRCLRHRVDGGAGRYSGHPAFTLLELVLALALSVVVLSAVGMAIELHLRAFHTRRNILEESQLARSVLRIISADIRNVVVHYEQDVSAIETLLSAGGGTPGGGGPEAAEDGAGDSPGLGSPDAAGGEADSTSLTDGDEVSPNTTGLAEATALPPTPGIYGNQYELQIDVSRLPRVDQYQQIIPSQASATLVDIPSDIKTVTYFVQTGSDASTLAALDPLATDAQASAPIGLVRRELDRAVTQWAVLNGNAVSLMQSGEALAPEVAGLEFQYFDGIEWRTEWDTQQEQALPLAVQIILLMQTPARDAAGGLGLAVGETTSQTARYYRLIVHLPAGIPAESSEQGGVTE